MKFLKTKREYVDHCACSFYFYPKKTNSFAFLKNKNILDVGFLAHLINTK
jgi:hypothetical protein